MHFIEAINRGWLSSFRYYGIYDVIDYSGVTWLGSRYDEQELLSEQLKDDVVNRIYDAWQQHNLTRTLAFCSSIAQADFLASFFRSQGHPVVSLHSQTKAMSRAEAIRRLETRELEIIFTVDLFNEGVDIPSVDTLLFVRPTESLTVFTQQVGRGLRVHEGKETCHIIDLIGNFRNADLKLSLFKLPSEEDAQGEKKQEELIPVVPTGCRIDLDLKVIDLLKELQRKRQPLKEKLDSAYRDVKQDLGRRPTYLELHRYGEIDSRLYRKQFGSYPGMLHWAEELVAGEQQVYERYRTWLEEVEGTTMLDRGLDKWHQPMTAKEAAPFFYQYLMDKEYRKLKDFSDKKTTRLWQYDVARVAQLVADMPMTKWANASKGLITFDGTTFAVQFNFGKESAQAGEKVFQWTREIAEYRLAFYFERRSVLVPGGIQSTLRIN